MGLGHHLPTGCHTRSTVTQPDLSLKRRDVVIGLS